ncbi:MAG: T9SS type A sorting domain-containing protein [Rhodothermales bacterium]
MPSLAQFEQVEWKQADGPFGGRYWEFAEDPYTGNIWTSASNKVYFSTNKGASWTYTGLEVERRGSFAFRSDGAIFAGTHRSYDGGESWRRVNLADSIYIRSRVFHNVESTLVAATNYGVHGSDDDGESWRVLSTEDVRKVWSVDDRIIAHTYSGSAGQNKLIQSEDNGLTWSVFPIPLAREVQDFMHTADGISYLLFEDSYGYLLYESSDLGESWELLSTRILGREFIGITPQGELIIEGGNHIYSYSLETNQASLIFEAIDRDVTLTGSSRRITTSMLTKDGSMYLFINYSELMRTDDLGATFTHLEGTGIIGTIVDQIVLDKETGDIWAGTRDYGVFLSKDEGETWANKGFFTYSLSALSLGNQPGELWASTYQNGLFRSMDNGDTWDFFESDSIYGKADDIQYDKAGDIRYILLHDDLYYSRDGGESWIGMNAPHDNSSHDQPVEGFTIGPNGEIYARVLFAQLEGKHGIFRTNDLGTTWEMVHEGSFERPWKSKLMFDSSGTLWLGEYNFLYRSNDNGVTWEEVLSFRGRVYALLETPDGSLWMGYGYGLMRSVDGGITWIEDHENLHECVSSLVWNEATSELLAGTGSGVYKGYIDTSIHVDIEAPTELVDESDTELHSYPNPVIDATQVSFSLIEDAQVRLVLIDQLGRQVSELLNTHVAAGKHEMNVDFSKLAPGVYFYRLQTPARVESKSVLHIR